MATLSTDAETVAVQLFPAVDILNGNVKAFDIPPPDAASRQLATVVPAVPSLMITPMIVVE